MGTILTTFFLTVKQAAFQVIMAIVPLYPGFGKIEAGAMHSHGPYFRSVLYQGQHCISLAYIRAVASDPVLAGPLSKPMSRKWSSLLHAHEIYLQYSKLSRLFRSVAYLR